jgi:serine/threonine-protein kinase
MQGDERRLLEIATRLSDGEAIDWAREEGVGDDATRRTVRHLRLVADVARVHRSEQGQDGAALDTAGMTATVNADELRPRPRSAGTASAPMPARWGHLEIRERLGEGSFGEVFRGWDVNLERDVALKLLKPGIARAHGEQALREGRMLARVRHPNVIAVYGAETHDGRIGLWMELVRGRTLDQVLRAHGRFGAREAALVGIDLARALAAVHGAGLLHRDVKLANVMRSSDGRYLLMDFGAGVEADDLRGPLSGTPLYIAPEVFAGRPASHASDVYSLGVLLYALVTGSWPVTGGSVSELREKHEAGDVRLLRDVRPDLPEPFLRVVEKALARDPAARFATAGQLEHALAASIGAEAPVPPEARRRPWTVAVVAVGTLALVAAAWIALEIRDASRPRIAAPRSSTSGSAAAYDIEATLLRQLPDGRRETLAPGETLSVGDELVLELSGSRDLYVYVFNEDATGNAFALFPLPGFELQNPLPGGTRHVLPGKNRDGVGVRWKVDTSGGEEHIVVVASPDPLVDFDREMASLPHPRANAVAMAVPHAARERLRGIGALADTPVPTGPETSRRLFEMARQLSGRQERVEGVWMREIELQNPGR